MEAALNFEVEAIDMQFERKHNTNNNLQFLKHPIIIFDNQ